MPIYQWVCSQCQKEVEIIRSFSEYENPPTEDEEPKAAPDAMTCKHEWARQVGDKIVLTRGPGWGWGSKGNW